MLMNKHEKLTTASGFKTHLAELSVEIFKVFLLRAKWFFDEKH